MVQDHFTDAVTKAPPFVFHGDAFMMRHAHSEGQIDKTLYRKGYCGDVKIPLSKRGEVEARQIGLSLDARRTWWMIFADDKRCEDTAAGIHEAFHALNTPHLEPYRCELIDKQNFGIFDGLLTDDERAEKYPEQYAEYKKQMALYGEAYTPPPEGESIADLYNRQARALQDIVIRWGEHKKLFGDERITPLVITHGTNILCMQAVMQNLDIEFVNGHIDTIPNATLIPLVQNNVNQTPGLRNA